MSDDAVADVRRCAVGLLSRREHARQELRRKLLARNFEKDSIEKALSQLESEGLQSDERYTESFVHQRSEKGYGPLRILQELKSRGIQDDLQNEYVDPAERAWNDRIARVRRKRFGAELPVSMQEKARQIRFLRYRGFTGEQIRRLMRSDFE